MPRRRTPSLYQNRRTKGWLALALCIFAVVGILIVTDIAHDTETYAPSTAQPIPSAINTPAGIQLSSLGRQTRTITRGETTQTQLVVSGTLKNTLPHPVVLPPLRLVLLNEAGIELDFWPVQWAMNPLPPGETLAYGATFLNANPANVAHIQPQFGARVNTQHLPPLFPEVALALNLSAPYTWPYERAHSPSLHSTHRGPRFVHRGA